MLHFGESGLKLSNAQLTALQSGSDMADSWKKNENGKWGNQSDAVKYIHGMCPKNMSSEDAIDAADNWINENVNEFVTTGDYEKLGMALHTYSDMTNPEHRDNIDDNGNVIPNEKAKPLQNKIIHGLSELLLGKKDSDKRKNDAKNLLQSKYKEAEKLRAEFLIKEEENCSDFQQNQ
jgi:hypothetical protein